VHQKKRRLFNLETRLEALVAQKEFGDPRICFGTRKLFRKQLNLEENGYRSHKEWQVDWRITRDSQFCVHGSKGETAGFQGCVATENVDGTFNLRVRLPDSLSGHEKYHPLRDMLSSLGITTTMGIYHCS
jgi:hypothetical protein